MFFKKKDLICCLIILIISVSFVNAENIIEGKNILLNGSNNDTNNTDFELNLLDDGFEDFTDLLYGAKKYTVFQSDNIVVSSILRNISDLDSPKLISGEEVYCVVKNSLTDIIGNESSVTNNNGIASVNLVDLNLSVGNYTVTWYYDGSDNYKAADSAPSDLEVKAKDPIPEDPIPGGGESSNGEGYSSLDDGHGSLPETGVPLVFLVLGLLFVGVFVGFRRK